jgi:hypothetical protein
MKVAEQIRNKIESIPESQPFGYDDLGIVTANFVTAAKALERLQKKGTIKKVSKGLFYKPAISIFGVMPPNYDAILQNYLYKNGERVGYITGGELYNSLNLTTQNYFRTKIATKRSRKKIEISWLKTTNVKAYVDITENNYKLLGILDAIKDIKIIADTSANDALKILIPKIKLFPFNDIQELLQLSLQYPPRTRALLGAIIDNIFKDEFDLGPLMNSLNPATIYKLNIKEEVLPTIIKWKIK